VLNTPRGVRKKSPRAWKEEAHLSPLSLRRGKLIGLDVHEKKGRGWEKGMAGWRERGALGKKKKTWGGGRKRGKPGLSSAQALYTAAVEGREGTGKLKNHCKVPPCPKAAKKGRKKNGARKRAGIELPGGNPQALARVSEG